MFIGLFGTFIHANSTIKRQVALRVSEIFPAIVLVFSHECSNGFKGMCH